MGLRSGPLKLRIEGLAGTDLEKLRERAETEGIVLAGPGEEVDLVATFAKAPPGALGGAVGRRRSPALSGRELEVLEYLVDGWSNAEIASALRIGVRTVRFHLESIYGKLGVSRRGEAVREAARLGLVRFEF